MTTQVDLDQALVALGDTPTKVFRRLKARGFNGERGKQDSCPVALYLKKISGAHSVRVSANFAQVEDEPINWHHQSFMDCMKQVEKVRRTAHLPLAVRLFIERFDNGSFPSLRS
jgi:hypothetical protein